MNDSSCVEFLRWSLPRLGMRWEGFRKVRGQVCKRLRRRLSELELADLAAYRDHLDQHPEEWEMLETMTHITISRFHRDRGVFGFLQQEVLPALATGVIKRGTKVLEVWIAGCASGEEAYTLTIMWELELTRRFPALALRILATDTDEAMLGRARRGCYQATSLRELPTRWHASAFSASDQEYCLREPFREPVTIVHHDVRTPPPAGPFDLVMCRNLAFTYFNLDLQRATVSRIDGALHCGGALVLGTHEALPENVEGFEPWKTTEPIYRHTTLPRAVADRGR